MRNNGPRTTDHGQPRPITRRACIVLLAAMASGTVAAPAAAVDSAVLEAQQRRVEVMERAAPSVVAIFGATGEGGGSGVLVTPDGYALTNFHVTSGAGDFMKCGLNDGKLYDAVIVGVDPTGDVAMIRLLGRDDFPTAPLGDSDTLQPGDPVFAMGNPFLLATDFSPTVTYGIVSGVHRYQYPAGTFLEYTDCIQTDASINPGNSGGPLFNADGELVGINGRGSFEKRGRVNTGAGYAISINQIKHFMGHLRSGRVVDHASLGATVASRSDGAVVVAEILDDSEAWRRGLETGDELVSFAGRPIRSVNQYKNILGIYPKGWKLPLVYRRDGVRHEIYVRLRGLHRASELVPKKAAPPRRPRPKPGDKDPDDKDPDDKQPGPIPGHPLMRKPPKPPEKYKHMYVARSGFANYYFNTVEQDRVLEGLKALGDFSSVGGRWVLSGKDKSGDEFRLTLTDDEARLELDGQPFIQPLDAEFADLPAGTGGLLVALHNLRVLLVQGGGGKQFTDFYYLGTEPLDGRGETADVLVSEMIDGQTGSRVECRWYFSEKDAGLLGFDTFLSEDTDECQVRFEDLKDVGGRKLPAKLIVKRADQEITQLNIEQAELRPVAK